ncbi:hypothetical protein D1816_02185 [Aquimarina sp. AD10]|uniref:hypothetical protein n=1 Tax=Aquimarina sp. AD10 TaxID=1714849 RepID=UPI000E5203DC|nr:hypothetical protein [Aquimarina sp. AD10]AXT59203.1 hypothetical protein D1816_02185 [Aquimarina sp. AD10]RKM92693.1 hypothetical protein D7033_20760 [Aquimarina sp. AD10]
MKIKLEQSTEILNKILEKHITSESKPWIEWAFDTILEFKAHYEIQNCSTNEETDELLAEYGTNNWNPEEDQQFEFTLTRQIQLDGEEEYYQIKLKLTFDPKNFDGIESVNFWAMDFGDATEWKSEIEKTDGYKKALQEELLNHEISIYAT